STSGAPGDTLRLDIDPKSHPAWTGVQRMLDSGGQVRVHAGAFGPDVLCDRAVGLLEQERQAPLFLYYPMVLPHSPFVRPPGVDESVKGEQGRFAAMVHHMDSLVGRVLDAAAGEERQRETLVIFVGDNGTDRRITSRWEGVDWEGVDIVGGKSRMNTHGTHVPMIAWWPGRVEPAACMDLVDFTDFLPTLCEAAGIALPETPEIDGVSFLPRLLGRPHEPREWIFCHYDPRWNVPGKPGRFAQDRTYRLHHDGRLIHVERDPLGQNPVEGDGGGSRQRLQAVLDRMPAWTPPDRARRPRTSED
ncbi:MAG: 50S ribosomal protein L31, partial [Planctomycetota bacterium]